MPFCRRVQDLPDVEMYIMKHNERFQAKHSILAVSKTYACFQMHLLHVTRRLYQAHWSIDMICRLHLLFLEASWFSQNGSFHNAAIVSLASNMVIFHWTKIYNLMRGGRVIPINIFQDTRPKKPRALVDGVVELETPGMTGSQDPWWGGKDFKLGY